MGMMDKSRIIAAAKQQAAAAEKAPVTAEVVPPVAKKESSKSTAARVVESIANAEDAVQLDTSVPQGAWQGNLAYLTALGDPSQKDNATFRNKKTGKEEVRTYSRIVGYRFKVLKPTRVPDFGTTDRFNGSRLNDAADISKWREAAAGETVDLTRVELLALLSQPGFAFEVKGGENPVRMQVVYARLNTTAPKSAADLPDVLLTTTKKGVRSIKDLGILDVLDYEPAEDQFDSGVKTVRPEFKGTKFEARCIIPPAHSGGRRSAGKGASQTARKNMENMMVATQTMLARVMKNQRG